MNAQEFASWIKGINLILNDHPPTKEQWAKIVEEASKLGAPPPAPAKANKAPSLNELIEEMDRKREDTNKWPRPILRFGANDQGNCDMFNTRLN